ncbi:hypothetical protein BGZ99_001983 [Dissophora globulifera]|uniref:Uncharacterized protein n=1 Tax=Dissophora globulifera TaxID=979702 RepID=A0A9P6RN93_9FUNG|nr:hypothetical protein BGZ99_001983 [Dissophora globulifera]
MWERIRIHEDSRGDQRNVSSPVKSDSEYFMNLRTYWDSLIARGGEDARMARRARAFLRFTQRKSAHDQAQAYDEDDTDESDYEASVPSPFESKFQTTITLRSYWDSQIAKGGETARLARQAEAFLRCQPEVSLDSGRQGSAYDQAQVDGKDDIDRSDHDTSGVNSDAAGQDASGSPSLTHSDSRPGPSSQLGSSTPLAYRLNKNGRPIGRRGPRPPYRRYTDRQRQDLLNYRFDKQLSISEAAKLVGMTSSTAARLVKQYEENQDAN